MQCVDSNDDEDDDEDQARQLSLFDDKDLVALLMQEQQPDIDTGCISSVETASVESEPPARHVAPMDHLYHKQASVGSTISDDESCNDSEAESFLGIETVCRLADPLSPLVTSSLDNLEGFSSPSPSSGYDSAHSPEPAAVVDVTEMIWEDDFTDLFPDLV